MAIKKEALVQSAVNSYLAGRHRSINKAAHAFNAPPSTIKHRVKNRLTCSDSHEKQKTLTKAEESELARWITQLTAIGYAPGFGSIKEMAEEIRRQRVRQINDNGIECVYYPLLVKNGSRALLIIIQS